MLLSASRAILAIMTEWDDFRSFALDQCQASERTPIPFCAILDHCMPPLRFCIKFFAFPILGNFRHLHILPIDCEVARLPELHFSQEYRKMVKRTRD